MVNEEGTRITTDKKIKMDFRLTKNVKANLKVSLVFRRQIVT